MADLVSLEFEGKTLGLTPSNLSKTTIARFFNVHEEGLHLKVVHNGKTENNWPLSNGEFLVPLGTTNAHVIAFNASEDSEDFVQGAFLPVSITSFISIILLLILLVNSVERVENIVRKSLEMIHMAVSVMY